MISFLVSNVHSNFKEGSLIINGEQVCDFVEDAVTGLGTGTYTLSIGKCPVQKRQIILVNPLSHTECERCVNAHCAIRKLRDKGNDQLDEAVNVMDGDALKAYERSVRADCQDAISQIHPPVCHRLVSGNGVCGKHDGRIVVGKFVAPGVVTDSKDTFNKLYKRLEKSIARGHTPEMEVVC